MFDHGVERAMAVALDAHARQVRKGSGHPYAVHPLHVALFLARLGHDPEIVQAGLLHDVVEDSEGWTIARVEAEFGDRVAGLVAEVTEDKDLPWADRKQWLVDCVPSLSSGALVIKACDKLHNLESLAVALRVSSDPGEVWAGFRGGRERSLEMSSRLVEALAGRVGEPLAGALRAALAAVRDL